MPDRLAPSEFGGKVGKNRVQPLPHLPTSSEALMLLYTTGAESGVNPYTGLREPDNGEAFNGLLPEKVQRALREQAGDLKKGEVWDELVRQAEAEAAK